VDKSDKSDKPDKADKSDKSDKADKSDKIIFHKTIYSNFLKCIKIFGYTRLFCLILNINHWEARKSCR
jgi:hypothetical protein